MEQYEGVRIECEYLGVSVDNNNDATDKVKYIKHPLDWPEIQGGDRSSQRRVVAKWTVHMSDVEVGNTAWEIEFPGVLNNILDRDHLFPQPPSLQNCRGYARLPIIASVSAQKAMHKYDGIRVDCEYLGLATNEGFGQVDRTYTKDPFRCSGSNNEDRSSHRKVYANWTVHILDNENGIRTWQAETEADFEDLVTKNCDFPEPDNLYITWATIRMTQKAREDPHAPCVFEKFITSTGGDLFAEFIWTGVYTDASLEHPYRSHGLLKNMLRAECRCVPWNPVTANNVDGLAFTIDFYDQLARKLNIRFAGVPIPPNGSATPWLEHRAPRELDTECMWVLESGRVIARPAGDIVMYDARLKLFGDNVSNSLEEQADESYNRTFAFRKRSSEDAAVRGSLGKHMQTSLGRYRIACMRYGFFAFLGVPRDISSFDRIRQANPKLQSEPWSVTTWDVPSDDCVPCWWVENAPLEEAQVHSIM